MRAPASPLTILIATAIGAVTAAVAPHSFAASGALDSIALESVMLDGATKASIHIQLDVGELWLGGGSMATGTVLDPTELLRGEFAIQGELAPAIWYEVTEPGGEGRLFITPAETDSLWSWSAPEQRWYLYLNPTIPTELEVQLGTGDAELVVGGMLLSDLAIDAGSGNVTLDLTGDWRTSLDGAISVGAGDVTIRAPRETGVRITAEQGVGAVRGQGFWTDDGGYVNAAYGTTASDIELHVEQGAGYIDLLEQ